MGPNSTRSGGTGANLGLIVPRSGRAAFRATSIVQKRPEWSGGLLALAIRTEPAGPSHLTQRWQGPEGAYAGTTQAV